jgi:AAT family amino acid transporter
MYIPAECIAGGIIMEYFTGINGYVWAVLFGLIITWINITEVSMFGEIEFWLSLIKIIALMAFVVIAILIFFGFIHGDQPSEIIGGKFISDQGGLFPNGIPVLLTTMVILLVNYQGSEIVGLAAGESANPSKMIPHAITNVTLRILFIYIVPVFCLVLIFPWYKANLDHIVFADALNYYGLTWAGAIASFVTLTAAISCANSGLYGIVRALNALAREGMAPHKLALLNHNGVPQNAVIVTLVAIWLVIALAYFFGQSTIYISLLLVSGFTGLMAWISICWAQINFRKRLYKAGYTTKDLKFKTPLSPYTGITAIIFMTVCLIFLLLNDNYEYKIAFIIGIISFVVPIIIHKFHSKRIDHKKEDDANRSLQFKDIFPKRI